MDSIIEVQLQDCPADMSPQIKEKAEQRFAKELARSFSTDDDLRKAFKLFTDASEGGMISKAEEKIATTWTTAFDKARQAGMRDVAVEEAFFEVRLS